MSRQLTSFVVAKSLNIKDVASTDAAASTNSIAVGQFGRASFLIDVGKPDWTSDWTTDAAIAVTIQYSAGDAVSDWAVTDLYTTDAISGTTQPTTGDISIKKSMDTDTASDVLGLYWIDLNLKALGITSGYLRAYLEPNSAVATVPADWPLDVIALMYDRDGPKPAQPWATVVQTYST